MPDKMKKKDEASKLREFGEFLLKGGMVGDTVRAVKSGESDASSLMSVSGAVGDFLRRKAQKKRKK